MEVERRKMKDEWWKRNDKWKMKFERHKIKERHASQTLKVIFDSLLILINKIDWLIDIYWVVFIIVSITI